MIHKKGNFKKGLYRPKNRNKYVGQKHPEYRSSWELHFFQWCDRNPNVLEWAAEAVVIPYTSPVDKKVHRYFVDNILILKEGNKNVKYLVEIKPFKQTMPPIFSRRKKKETLLHEQVTYEVNKSKWDAANDWANKNGYKFIILTEKELFPEKK